MAAAAGIFVNGITTLRFMSGRKSDMKRASRLPPHCVPCVGGVRRRLAGGSVPWTGWHSLDPAISLVIGAVIVLGTWSLLRWAGPVVGAVPEGIDKEKVESAWRRLPGWSECTICTSGA